MKTELKTKKIVPPATCTKIVNSDCETEVKRGSMSTRAQRAKTVPSDPWQSITRPRALHTLMLVRLVGGVWTFQDPKRERLYQLVIDHDGKECWSCKDVQTEREWLSQSEAARLIRVTREAIRNAIVHGRLATMVCNGRSVVRRSEILALNIVRRHYKH
jgi:hypothetical protein